MKHYAVILFDASRIDSFVKHSKIAFAGIRNALCSFKKGKIATATIDVHGNKYNVQVHKAEPIDTNSLLLVKSGVMSNVVDITGLVTDAEQVEKFADLQTAQVLLKAAEEHLLYSVAKSIYMGLPMDAHNNRDVSSAEAQERINKRVAANPVIARAIDPVQAGKRVYAYITQHPDCLREQVFIGAI